MSWTSQKGRAAPALVTQPPAVASSLASPLFVGASVERSNSSSTAQSSARAFSVSAYGRALFALAIVHSAMIIGSSIMYVSDAQHASEAFWNEQVYGLALLLVLTVFFCYFCWSAVCHENNFEMASFVLATCLVTARMWYQAERPDRPGKAAFIQELVAILTSVVQCIYFCLAYVASGRFGWHVYKRVGGSMELIAMFRRFQVFLSLLKLDFMCSLVLLITGFFARAWSTLPGVVITVTMVPLSAVWAFLLNQAIRRESLLIFRVCMPFVLLQPSYVIYKALSLLNGPSMDPTTAKPLGIPLVILPSAYVIFLAIVALLLRAAVLTLAILCRRNFFRGLKEMVLEKPPVHATFFGRI